MFPDLTGLYLALITSVVAPAVLLILTSWSSRKEKKAEHEIAEKLINRADFLLRRNEILEGALEIATKRLDALQVLVKKNGTSTYEYKNMLEGIRTELNLFLKAVELNKAMNSPEATASLKEVIEKAKVKIVELEAKIPSG